MLKKDMEVIGASALARGQQGQKRPLAVGTRQLEAEAEIMLEPESGEENPCLIQPGR